MRQTDRLRQAQRASESLRELAHTKKLIQSFNFSKVSELMQALSDLLLKCFKWQLFLSCIYCQMRQCHGLFKKLPTFTWSREGEFQFAIDDIEKLIQSFNFSKVFLSSCKPFQTSTWSIVLLFSKQMELLSFVHFHTLAWQCYENKQERLSCLLLECVKWHLLSNEARSQLSSIRFVTSCNRRHWKVHTSFNFSNSSNLCLRAHGMCSLRQTASESFTEVVAHIKKLISTFKFSKDFWAHANLLKKWHICLGS